MPIVPDPSKPRLRNAVLQAALCSVLCAALSTSVVLPVPARAAVLGEAKVRSFLGQKLDAEIEISALTAAESEALLVRIPAADAFASAGIDMTALVRSLRVTLEKRGEQTFVRLNSDQAIAEPFLMVLVELNAGGTRTLRQYALLIDPAPVDRPQQAANVEPAIAEPQLQEDKGAAADARAPSAAGNAGATPATAPNAPNATASSSTNAANGNARLIATTSRRVRKGDTLATIGNEVKPEGVRLEQVLVALQRANPQAFEGNNINRMKSGSVLSVPSADSMRDIDATAARRIVIAQSADFQRYREALAERMNIPAANRGGAANDASTAAAGNRSSSGTVGVTVKEPGARPEPQDQLKLTAPGQAGANGAGNAAGKAANANGANDRKTIDQIAADKALAEANSRIAALEKNLTQMEQLLEVRDRKLADTQKAAELAAKDAKEAKAATEANKPAPSAAPSPTNSATPASAPAPASSTAATGAPPNSATPAATPATPATAPTGARAPAAADGKPKPAAQAPAMTPAVSQAAGWAGYLNDPVARVVAAGAVLLALLALLGQRMRARRSAADKQGRRGKGSKVNLVGSAAAPSAATAAATDAAAAAGAANAAAADAADADEASKASEAAATKAASTAPILAAVKPDPKAEGKTAGKPAASDVDAIAEADVYIAYGRDEQAEEILRDALRDQPQRHALRVKLLEIYASRRDRKAFGELATELCALTAGKGSAWEQAAQMGQMLDPGNPLYGSLPQAMDSIAQRHPTPPLQAVPSAGKEEERPPAGSPVDDFGLKLEGLLDEQRREQGKPPAPMQPSAASATPDFSLSGIGRGEAGGRRIEPTLTGEPDHAALTTKLDLAQACEEIGDHEGARELLAEVAAARDPELSRRAQDLLRKLA